MSTHAPVSDQAEPRLVMADLGLTIEAVGDELHGRGDVVANMWQPGTETIRPSILVTWADTILGLLAAREMAPQVPVTLELDVHLFDDLTGTPTIRSVGQVAKAGRSVLVLSIDFLVNDERVGFGHAMFMAAPDPTLRMPTGSWALDRFKSVGGTLDVPFADRVGCKRLEPGEASMPCAPELLNRSKTLNGGLLAVVIEEAALSAYGAGATMLSMHIRYMRPVRTGPAIATAESRGDLAEVHVRDAATDGLCVIATTRAVAAQKL